MTQKLFAFAQGMCCQEGADAIMVQEVLTGGLLYQQVTLVALTSDRPASQIILTTAIDFRCSRTGFSLT